jgi:hypothetical protein
MTTRRELLQAGLCVATTAAVIPAMAAKADVAEVLPLHKVVYDERFGAGRQFAAAASRQGASVHGISGGVHDLWYDDLYHQWKSSPVAVAGMTTHDAMFLLSMMAEVASVRLIYRAHHMAVGAQGGFTHEVFGPVNALAQQPALTGLESEWARTAAHIVTAWPKSAVQRSWPESTIARASEAAVARNTLVTWVLAPQARPA